jgi:hypothetical protein
MHVVGPHKHFLVIQLQAELQNRTGTLMPIEEIWERIENMFDVAALDRMVSHFNALTTPNLSSGVTRITARLAKITFTFTKIKSSRTCRLSLSAQQSFTLPISRNQTIQIRPVNQFLIFRHTIHSPLLSTKPKRMEAEPSQSRLRKEAEK